MTGKRKRLSRARRASQSDRAGARRGIQSAGKAIDVLLALVDLGGTALLRDLARKIDMPPSLAHRYLSSLLGGGLIVRHTPSGGYELGPAALRIGAVAIAGVDALRFAGEAMPRLVDSAQLTALLVVMGDRGPTIVRWERAPMPFVTALAVGSVLPLTKSASGRSLLAFTPPRVADRLISLDLGFEGIGSKTALLDRLTLVRERGYDATNSTVVPGLAAISAPILDRQNEAVASLTLMGASEDVQRGEARALAALLSAASEVSLACGATLTFNDGLPFDSVSARNQTEVLTSSGRAKKGDP